MNIHVYSMAWKESLVSLRAYYNYYDCIADHVHVYTDRSKKFDENKLVDFKNTVWKKARGVADYVIVCDIDEIIFNQGEIRTYLKRYPADVYIPRLYEMTEESKGVKFGHEKPILFNPNRIASMHYSPGAHTAEPTIRKFCNGDTPHIVKTDAIKLLHYKWLDVEAVYKRHKQYLKRLSENNILNRWGSQYFYSRKAIKLFINTLRKHAVEI